MSLLSLPIGKNAPVEVHAIIEIPKGSSNKYEYDLHLNAFVLDRVLYSPLYYPCDYGWVAGTLSGDGDPLDILVLGSHPSYPGCVVLARPIGALMMRDEEGTDTKIIAVSSRDPRFPDDRLRLCASHTHSGPGAFSPGLFASVVLGAYDPKVLDLLVERIASAA